MFQTSGTCTQQQPGIPEQVVQHLNHIRLENLLAPRWSIILNEHGCQLQVFWGSPKGGHEQTGLGKPVPIEPPVKKMRPDGPIAFVNQPPQKTPVPTNNVAIRQIGAAHVMRQNHIVQPKSPDWPKSQKPVMASPFTGPTPHQQPLPPQVQPQQPPPTLVKPRAMYIQESGPSSRPVTTGTKIAQVSVPNREKTRKSIESTALMLMGREAREFSANQSIAHSPIDKPPPPISPTGIVTPPGSERSSSGDGKEPDSDEKIKNPESFGSDFISEMYRQKFSCEICRKTFTRKYSLSRHYKEVHQGESRSNKFQTIGPTMVTGQNLALPLNDYGLPSMARLPGFHDNAGNDIKIEEYDEDDSAPSMVIKRQSPLEF